MKQKPPMILQKISLKLNKPIFWAYKNRLKYYIYGWKLLIKLKNNLWKDTESNFIGTIHEIKYKLSKEINKLKLIVINNKRIK